MSWPPTNQNEERAMLSLRAYAARNGLTLQQAERQLLTYARALDGALRRPR